MEEEITFGRLLNYDIHISATNNNCYIVKVGCCTMAYDNHVDLLNHLRQYLTDLKGTENKYHTQNTNIPVEAPTYCDPV